MIPSLVFVFFNPLRKAFHYPMSEIHLHRLHDLHTHFEEDTQVEETHTIELSRYVQPPKIEFHILQDLSRRDCWKEPMLLLFP